MKDNAPTNRAATAASAVAFLTEIMRLKAVPRLGWLLRGVRDVESVASHSFGTAVIAMLLADSARARGADVNVERVLRMALLHDLTEARTGDLPSTVKRYFAPGALHHANEKAAADILEPLGLEGEALFEVWREYEDRETLESRIVKAADKLDLLLQAREYERGGARSLSEFWDSAGDDFTALGLDDLIEDLIEELSGEQGVDGAD
ncbi:MAG: HD family hydrolase [Acidobacteria bacterium]|nr:HD family hydrolase [Acidobacteriota bacterium]